MADARLCLGQSATRALPGLRDTRQVKPMGVLPPDVESYGYPSGTHSSGLTHNGRMSSAIVGSSPVPGLGELRRASAHAGSSHRGAPCRVREEASVNSTRLRLWPPNILSGSEQPQRSSDLRSRCNELLLPSVMARTVFASSSTVCSLLRSACGPTDAWPPRTSSSASDWRCTSNVRQSLNAPATRRA